MAGAESSLPLHPLETFMLGDGGDRDRAADGFGPRDGELHKADHRFHEETRQINSIADGYGLYEEELEQRGRELGMQVASGVRREPAAGGPVLKAASALERCRGSSRSRSAAQSRQPRWAAI